ncbi:MAG TPA: hypothetical protein VI056_13775 [Candidatus Limnocylindria bacterium]
MPKQKTCQSCGRRFPAKAVVDGIMRDLHRRRFCFSCSPFRAHNTSHLAPGSDPNDRRGKVRLQRLQSWSRYGRKRRRQRKRDLVSAAGGACVECGYARSIAALEFHHRDAATKLFGIAKFNGSQIRLLAEVAKCDLLCANCHRRRHATIDASTNSSAPRRRKLKARAVSALGGRCEGCTQGYESAIFEFHHRDGATKEFGISENGLIRGWEEVASELAKCVLLCANCHREVHAGSRDINVPLGFSERPAVYQIAV